MRDFKIVYALILLFGVFISSLSQVMLKKASEKKYDSPIKEYLNPLVVSAYTVFAAATFISVIAYRGIPLSMGPVLETTSYIYVSYFGVKIFHEKIGTKKFMALGLIITGIIVYSLFG
ncbi:MAG: multidrug ABC transporter [Lachnospiraceae bacterium]|nr:multidrug ABC transporter [Lachnospiraceae bacterium]